jgi:hypothetical protein
MELNVSERFGLVSILPQKENVFVMRLVEDLRRELLFTEEEIKQYNIIFNKEDGKMYWNDVDKPKKNFELGETTLKIIKEALDRVDKEKAVTPTIIPLYDKFVPKTE